MSESETILWAYTAIGMIRADEAVARDLYDFAAQTLRMCPAGQIYRGAWLASQLAPIYKCESLPPIVKEARSCVDMMEGFA